MIAAFTVWLPGEDHDRDGRISLLIFLSQGLRCEVMNGKGQNSGEVIAEAQPLNGLCWVQCKGYRCLAVLSNGKWSAYATGEELTDFIRVISAVPADWL